MKYKLLFILPFALLAMGATAQENNASEEAFPRNLVPRHAIGGWTVGLFGGVDKNHHSIDVGYASDIKYTDRSGITAGITASYNMTGWFSLRADLAMVQKNYRMDRDNSLAAYVYTETTNNYFSLPVTAVLSLGRTFRVNGFFGGYVGYWMSSHREGQSFSLSYFYSNDASETMFDADYEFNSTRDNRFDAGLTYGIALRCAIIKKIELSAELRWYYSLTDIQKAYAEHLNPRYNTTRALQFGLGYWF